MNNKKVAALLSVCTAATMLTACENFNPEAEYEMDIYGPAPVIQEEIEDNAEVEEEEKESEPEQESETEQETEQETEPEEELEDDFDAESDSLQMRTLYGVDEIQKR